jgi:hypothetical protein
MDIGELRKRNKRETACLPTSVCLGAQIRAHAMRLARLGDDVRVTVLRGNSSLMKEDLREGRPLGCNWAGCGERSAGRKGVEPRRSDDTGTDYRSTQERPTRRPVAGDRGIGGSIGHMHLRTETGADVPPSVTR